MPDIADRVDGARTVKRRRRALGDVASALRKGRVAAQSRAAPLPEAFMARRTRIATALVLVFALAGLVAAPVSLAAPAAPKAAASEARPIDLNSADTTTLESVPGIGKSLSQRIVAFRDKNGPFQSVDDLLKVQGVGEKSIQKLRPYLTVSKAK